MSSVIKKLATEELFISCAGNLEPWLVNELKGLGVASVRRGHRGAFAPRTIENVYAINYGSRIATRVLWPLIRFPCPHREALYAASRLIDWNAYFSSEKSTLAIDANIDAHPSLKNSHFAALVVKDAVCDALRASKTWRPSIDLENPTVQLNLFIHKGIATLYFDTSGKPLFKRGYRAQTGEAPLQESLAAAILQMSRYNPESDILCDPFCGSGTFLVEAAMLATHTPAGFYRRSWGFSAMPDFLESKWRAFRARVDQNRIPLAPGKIFGADGSPSSIAMTRAHLEAAGFSAVDTFSRSIQNFSPPFSPTLIVCNPPYGRRLETSAGIYSDLGRFAKRYENSRLFFLASDERMAKASNIPHSEAMSCLNGGLPVKLYQSLTAQQSLATFR